MSETVLSAQQIQELLPHRWPFLMVDRIIELEPGARAVGIKNVSINEPFFQGHFPGYPIMPGVLIVEALAQVGSVALLSLEQNRGKVGYFRWYRLVPVPQARPARRRSPHGSVPRTDTGSGGQGEGESRG